MAKKADKKTKKQAKPTITPKFIYKIAMVCMIIIFIVAIIHQCVIRAGLREQEAELLTQIAKEEAVGNVLKNQQESKDTPEFIEKVAREKLNMVKPNEIVYVDKNKKASTSKVTVETTTAAQQSSDENN